MVSLYDLSCLILKDIMIAYDVSNEQLDDVISFLNDKNDKFNEILKSYDILKEEDYHVIKRVIMLTIISYAYLVNLYNVRIDIDAENSQKYVDYLESLSAKEIVDMFACHSPEIKTFYGDSANYVNNSYIYRYCCWANALSEGKEFMVLKLNPFTLLECQDINLGDGFVETEVCIQLFDDLYCKALEMALMDSEAAVTESLEFSKIIVDYFREGVDNHFNGDVSQINCFYSLIFSNIYENIIINSNTKKQRRKFKTLIQKIEECSTADLMTLFMDSYQFAIEIIDSFITFNDNLEKDDLIKRRLEFMKKGNSQKLAEINPFYARDVEVLKKIKKKSSNF